MVIITIFWLAILAIFFYLLGMSLKGIAAIIYGGGRAVLRTLKITLLGVAGLIALQLLRMLINSFLEGYFFLMFMEIASLIIMVAILLAIFGGVLGGLCRGIIDLILDIVFGIGEGVTRLLKGACESCDKAYMYFLKIIINKLERC